MEFIRVGKRQVLDCGCTREVGDEYIESRMKVVDRFGFTKQISVTSCPNEIHKMTALYTELSPYITDIKKKGKFNE